MSVLILVMFVNSGFVCCCDLDLDPMTLTYEDDLDILKINELYKSKLSIVTARTGQTDRQTEAPGRITTRHSAMVIIFVR